MHFYFAFLYAKPFVNVFKLNGVDFKWEDFASLQLLSLKKTNINKGDKIQWNSAIKTT